MKKYKKKNIKIGVLGGTFDPPHIGHLYISKVGIKKLKLNKLIWAIAKKNPFKKKPHFNVKKRIKLSKEITKNNKKIVIHYLDNKIKSSNTYDLLNFIKKKNLKAKLYFLIGSDNLKKFHKWANWKKIPQIAKIVIFPRKNYLKRSIARQILSKKDLMYINCKKIDISSSLIRKFW